jgi:isopentenyldiphosphate isomerase
MPKYEEMNVVVDDNGNSIGTASRHDVHTKGLRHLVVATVVVLENPRTDEIDKAWLFTQRSSKKPILGGMDCPIIGEHYQSGDKDKRAAIFAGIKEELKIHPDHQSTYNHLIDNVVPLGLEGCVDLAEFKTTEKPFFEVIYLHLFGYKCPVPYECLVPDREEITDLKGVDYGTLVDNPFIKKLDISLKTPNGPRHGHPLLDALGNFMTENDPRMREILGK